MDQLSGSFTEQANFTIVVLGGAMLRLSRKTKTLRESSVFVCGLLQKLSVVGGLDRDQGIPKIGGVSLQVLNLEDEVW